MGRSLVHPVAPSIRSESLGTGKKLLKLSMSFCVGPPQKGSALKSFISGQFGFAHRKDSIQE